ncbi:MAG: GNAT family N-acetyltransferase [Bacteroidales bacterium]|nr:GNAT family N-acetyltransferase [Bacteroides sp.]MCM1197433.1 GNAT family N-acetyltransferase [Clostridium sp.]MCM1502924.1 GNAT family N-acetyltransferase [Bacteroidales bacterium]
MENIEIKIAEDSDKETLADIFMGHLTSNSEYISHGELQMGVGIVKVAPDGEPVFAPAPDGRKMWLKYISEKIGSDDAAVYKAVSGGEIVGFCVADIEEDGAAPFGMVCDVLVRHGVRGGGAGGRLLEAAVAWLRSRGISDIYLESGKDNHAAHEFFMKRGFVKVSEIFKLM